MVTKFVQQNSRNFHFVISRKFFCLFREISRNLDQTISQNFAKSKFYFIQLNFSRNHINPMSWPTYLIHPKISFEKRICHVWRIKTRPLRLVFLSTRNEIWINRNEHTFSLSLEYAPPLSFLFSFSLSFFSVCRSMGVFAYIN